jgi:cyclohexanone monooxygenase
MNIPKALNGDWAWQERLPAQDEVLQYLRHIADRFDLRKDIELATRVTSAQYDSVWKATNDKGHSYSCRYLVTAVGPLSAPRHPPFPGLESFRGEWYQTSSWQRKPFPSRESAWPLLELAQ